MKRRIWLWLILITYLLAACGVNSTEFHVFFPATEVLENGETLSCPRRGDFSITTIEEENVRGIFSCIERNGQTNQDDIVRTMTFTAPNTNHIHELTSKTRYNWGVVVRDGVLIQVYIKSVDLPGEVAILWPPFEEEEN